MSANQPVPLRPWNAPAIVASVQAFVEPPGGIVCGHIARRQICSTGEQGDGLALGGLVLGSVCTAAIVLFVLNRLAVVLATPIGFAAIVTRIPAMTS